MSFLRTQNSELSSNLTKQHCLTPSTCERGNRGWPNIHLDEGTDVLYPNSPNTHTSTPPEHTHTHTGSLFWRCPGIVVHHSIEPEHHLLHSLHPSWKGCKKRNSRWQHCVKLHALTIRSMYTSKTLLGHNYMHIHMHTFLTNIKFNLSLLSTHNTKKRVNA